MYRERSNGKDYFILEIEEEQELDRLAIRMMEENIMQGIMPFRKVSTLENNFFEYEIMGQDTLQYWLAMTHNKREVISLLNSLIQIHDEAEVNLLEEDHLCTEQECIAVENDKCYMAYIPYTAYTNGGLIKLAEDIIYQVSVFQNENYNYIYDLRNAFSSDEIAEMADLKKWLNNIQEQEEGKREEKGSQNYGDTYQQTPIQEHNTWMNFSGMSKNTNPVPEPIAAAGDNLQSNISKKKEEKTSKKSFFKKKEKEQGGMQATPEVSVASTPFDNFFDDIPKQKTVTPSYVSGGSSAVEGANAFHDQTVNTLNTTDIPTVKQEVVKEAKAQKSAGKFKIPSFGSKKQKKEPNEGMPMMQNAKMKTASYGEMTAASGGRLINELEFENEGTVLMSQENIGVIRGKDFPNGFILEKSSYILGIGQQADIRLTGNGTVSRKHARIYKQACDFYIVDEGSLNGTFVNNVQLMAHEPCKLENGARIHLSDEIITFEMR